jgi:glyceraldehyde 3-phosphate dehydrogenase
MSHRDPEACAWGERGVDLVMECTGLFTSAEAATRHLDAGAGRVLVSAPSSGADATIVYGVNHDSLTPDMRIISNASCTTNCLAPVAAALQESCGINQGFMTTIHAYTGDQNLVDGDHKDPYRARAAALNMVPSTTGAARAVGLVLPALDGKLDGVAIRVPTPNVSAVDLVFEPARRMTAGDINAALTQAAERMGPVMNVTDRPLVSSDFNHDPASAVVHLDQTRVMPGGMARVLAWYDNEWGFSNRMLDTAGTILKL